MSDVEEGTIGLVAIVGLGLLVAAAGRFNLCVSLATCQHAGSCHSLDENTCGFGSVVAPAALSALQKNVSDASDAYGLLSRGVCTVGSRQTARLDAFGRGDCARAMSYPNGFLEEIADPLGATPHERACGKWIESVAAPTSGWNSWGFFDSTSVRSQVRHSLRDDLKLRAGSAEARFYGLCEETASTFAGSAASALGYADLKARLKTQETLDGKIGVLIAHGCPAPIRLGLGFGERGATAFVFEASAGTELHAEQASSTLYHFDDSEQAEVAAEFAQALQAAFEFGDDVSDQTQLNAILAAALRDSDAEEPLRIQTPVSIAVADEGASSPTASLRRFHATAAATAAAHAHAYLDAMAGVCVSTIRGLVDGSAPIATPVSSLNETVVALGRIAARNHAFGGRLSRQQVRAATAATWADLAIDAGRDRCFALVEASWAERFDAEVFGKLAGARAASILKPLGEMIKTQVATTVESGRAATALFDAATRATLKQRVLSAGVVFAGSTSNEQPGMTYEANQGPISVLLERARAIFSERALKVLNGASLCEHDVLVDSTERNAYYTWTANGADGCVVILPGLLVEPFFSSRYDAGSLYSRIGYVLAHEFAHVSATIPVDRWLASADALLKGYFASEYYEAVADLIGVEAVHATGVASSQSICRHVSQLWCGKGTTTTPGSHPQPNRRGDLLCEFLP